MRAAISVGGVPGNALAGTVRTVRTVHTYAVPVNKIVTLVKPHQLTGDGPRL